MTDDEINRLQVGDVFLYGKRKTPRIVRGIVGPTDRSLKPWNRVLRVVVAIRKCSWTGAADTQIDRYTLKTACEWTGMRVKLDDAADLLFELEQCQPPQTGGKWIMGCCLGKDLPA